MKRNGVFCLAGFLIAFALKYYYSTADSDALLWILAPTAWWVRILSGIEFVYEPGAGYVSHALRFVIAPSCSGVQFMIILIITLICSFVRHTKTKRGGSAWVVFSTGVSWLFTIFINGFRIALSLYLPLFFRKRGLFRGWLTPERLHTITGVVIYVLSLLAICRILEHAFRKRNPGPEEDLSPGKADPARGYILPVFWYFFIVLGVPFLNRACRHNGEAFMEYALLICSVCIVTVFLAYLLSVFWKWIRTA